jgi:hypothetical protein
MSWSWSSDETDEAIIKSSYRREHLLIGPRTHGLRIMITGFFDNLK